MATIGQPGGDRLAGNLFASSPDWNIRKITADPVALDLNGLFVSGLFLSHASQG